MAIESADSVASCDVESGRGAVAWVSWNYAVTILVSAFLLFQVQPLISKAILPWFGGSPAVWTTCMLFFQTVLFAGYAYAHLIERWFRPRGQVILHLCLIALALAVLPITPAASWKPADSASPTWRILGLLAATVGLPYFVLSATSPLVQVWFSWSHPGRSPYRLYAVSNFGSMVALLSYPFLFEPAFNLDMQSWLWSGAFLLYAAFCLACAIALWKCARSPGVAADAEKSPAAAPKEPAAAPTWLRRLLWLLLPAVASLMLLATTNHVCQDVAVVPFLWVVPLALYLLSFIICFDHQRWYVRPVWASLAAAAIVACGLERILGGVAGFLAHIGLERFANWCDYTPNYVEELVIYFAALLFACMVCHGELVRLRPDPRRLTEFYLMISAGGALGGIFVSLVAPVIFSTFFEWKIGLVLCYCLAVGTMLLPGASGREGWGRKFLALPAAAGLAVVVYCQMDMATALERVRNFYGVVSVQQFNRDDPEKHRFVLRHGAIIHGEQYAEEKKRHLATTYYTKASGVGQAIQYFYNRPAARVGVVGLGVGTVATYARPGDTYRFYEINPQVLRLAEGYFHYLDDCQGTCDVVMGDARLSLERELDDQPQNFDVLVLDAFSGDSIPTHLLTREAFDLYQRHIAAHGVIAVHITNSYLYLAPVMRAVAADCGLQTVRIYVKKDDSRLQYRSDWMLLTRNADFLKAVAPLPPEEVHDDFTVPLWTDHYSNLFQILKSD